MSWQVGRAFVMFCALYLALKGKKKSPRWPEPIRSCTLHLKTSLSGLSQACFQNYLKDGKAVKLVPPITVHFIRTKYSLPLHNPTTLHWSQTTDNHVSSNLPNFFGRT